MAHTAFRWNELNNGMAPLVPSGPWLTSDPTEPAAVEPKPSGSPWVTPQETKAPVPTKQASSPWVPVDNPQESQQIQHDRARLQEIQKPDMLSSHEGVGGKIGHVLSRIGNVAGNVLIPSVMQNIRGTDLNKQAEEHYLSDRIANEQSGQALNESRRASTQKTKQDFDLAPQEQSDKHALTEAQIGNYQSEDWGRRHPKEDLQHFATDDGFFSFNPQSGEVKQLQYGGKPIAAAQKLSYQTVMGPDGKPHTYGINQRGEKVQDLGEHYERPITVNNGGAAIDRESKQFGAPHQKAVDAADAQLEKIIEARAMINGSAENQALGIPKVMTALVSGQGSGVRITQAELNAIAKARGIGDSFDAALQRMNTGKSLTPKQVQQLNGLLDDVKGKISSKRTIHSNALDTINGSSDRGSIVDADKSARKAMSDLERFGHFEGETVMVKGKPVVIKKIHDDGSFE